MEEVGTRVCGGNVALETKKNGFISSYNGVFSSYNGVFSSIDGFMTGS